MAIAFAVTWLERRSIATVGFDAARLGLASIYVPAALFAYGIAVTLHEGARRAKWLFLAGLVLALLVATGTRATLVLLVVPLAIAFGARRQLAPRACVSCFSRPSQSQRRWSLRS